MMRALAVLLLFTSIHFNLLAQGPNPFLGTWKVTWQGSNRELEAELIISDKGGSWKTYATARQDPCIGREVPIAIETSSPDEMTITLKFAEVVNGCPNSTVKLQRADNGVTGTRGKSTLTLTRK